mmetsp:Transcript_8562/g.25361  ORF Transcript_8562/g.25361 Transcript_8562/m.25361 type:complete len:118 (+) Transcript_8562:541-894(+)
MVAHATRHDTTRDKLFLFCSGLFFFAMDSFHFISFLFVLQREKLLEDRKKKVVHLEHAMKQIQKQLDDYHKGHKRLDQNRVKSLKNRLASYKGQIYDYSKELSDKEIEELLGYHSEL